MPKVSKTLRNFLIKLSKDPAKADEFRKDPEGTIAKLKLSPAAKHVLSSTDPDHLRTFLIEAGSELAGGSELAAGTELGRAAKPRSGSAKKRTTKKPKRHR